MDKIYIIHENDDWMPPFREAFQSEGLPFEEWHMARVSLDLEDTPPEGVFYSRMSASAHTRGHRSIPEYTAGVLCWLEHHGQREPGARSGTQQVTPVPSTESFGYPSPPHPSGA